MDASQPLPVTSGESCPTTQPTTNTPTARATVSAVASATLPNFNNTFQTKTTSDASGNSIISGFMNMF